jgi:hypothetical protein
MLPFLICPCCTFNFLQLRNSSSACKFRTLPPKVTLSAWLVMTHIIIKVYVYAIQPLQFQSDTTFFIYLRSHLTPWHNNVPSSLEWGSHGGERVKCGVLGYEAVWFCMWFRRSCLPANRVRIEAICTSETVININISTERHNPGDWLSDRLTGWWTGWLLADWLMDWLANRLTGWLTGWWTDWLTDWLADGLVGWHTDWLTDLLAG